MGRYDFVSTGAAGGNAIQQFLIQRAMQQRQAQMDAIAQQAQQRQAEQQAAELRLRQQQEARVSEAQAASQADLANQREFGRATTISENAMPHDPADEATRGLLTRQGYGGQVQKTPGIMVPLLGTSEASDATVKPEGYEMRGGSKYLAARTAADERGAQAEQARADRDAEAGRQRDFVSSQNDANRENARAIAGATNARITSQQDEVKAEKQAAADKAAGDARTVTQSALDQLQRLKTHPGLNRAQGAYEMRGFTQPAQDFNAIRDQVVNALALPNLGALKGPMSDKDIMFVKNISTRLGNHNISEEEAGKAIDEAITFLQGKLTGGGNAGGGGSSFRVVGVR